MAGARTYMSEGTGDSRVIITSPEITDAKQAVNDHFQRSIECAVLGSSGGKPAARQWPERNLPEAFFSKPAKTKSLSSSRVSHSRDGSADSSGPPRATSGPLVQHCRTHSLPAIVKDAREGGYDQTNPSLVHHQKHRSFDNTFWPQEHQRYGEGTSRSLGDLAAPAVGGDPRPPARKVSCGDEAAGQPMQKPPTHFVRQQRHQAAPAGGVRSQILKRQQQQQYHQMPPSAASSPYANPVVQELNLERQRMYERHLQLRQQGLLDLQHAEQAAPHGPQFVADYRTGQYSAQPMPQHNPHYHPRPPAFQPFGDSAGATAGEYDAYLYPPTTAEIDANFSNISLDTMSFMEVDQSAIPHAPLDLNITPSDLDRYLNH